MGVLHRPDIGERKKSAHFFEWFVQRLLHERHHLRPKVNEHPLGLSVAQAAQADGGAEKIRHKGVQQHTTAPAFGDPPYRVEESQANGQMAAAPACVNAGYKGLEERLLYRAPQCFQSSPARTCGALPQLLRQERNVQVTIDLMQALSVSPCRGAIRMHIGNQITRSNFPFEIIVKELRQVDLRGLVTEEGFQAVRQADRAGGKEGVGQL